MDLIEPVMVYGVGRPLYFGVYRVAMNGNVFMSRIINDTMTASDDVASFVRLSKLELDPSKFVPSWSDDMERLIALAFEQQYRP